MSKREATHGMILDRALALASMAGFDSLSIAGIAKEAGLSKSGLFAHFESKEDLQLQVLSNAVERFIETVISPALRHARGEARVRALFDNWLSWGLSDGLPGGCLFIGLSTELDDRPGPLRDALVAAQKDWMDTLATAARIAVEEGQFHKDLDIEQFAFDLFSIILVYFHFNRLLRDPNSLERARRAFEDLLSRSRAIPPASHD